MAPGQMLPPLEVADITRERMLKVMAVMGDENPLHDDEALASELGFRGIVNQGPANLAYVVNMLLRWCGNPTAIRSMRFRFLDNVVPGDELEARATVTALDEGEVECAFELASAQRLHLTGTTRLAYKDA